jgi:hypothetical protein
MTLLAVRHLMLRHATALAPLIVLVAPIDRAEAACTPASPVDNTIVECTGATTNQNGANGYGSGGDATPSDSGNTYNIVSGASLTGTRIGLLFDKALIINNFGTITGGSVDGVRGTIGVVNNFGAISGASSGVDIFGTGIVNNFGSITGVNDGVAVQSEWRSCQHEHRHHYRRTSRSGTSRRYQTVQCGRDFGRARHRYS